MRELDASLLFRRSSLPRVTHDTPSANVMSGKETLFPNDQSGIFRWVAQVSALLFWHLCGYFRHFWLRLVLPAESTAKENRSDLIGQRASCEKKQLLYTQNFSILPRYRFQRNCVLKFSPKRKLEILSAYTSTWPESANLMKMFILFVEIHCCDLLIEITVNFRRIKRLYLILPSFMWYFSTPVASNCQKTQALKQKNNTKSSNHFFFLSYLIFNSISGSFRCRGPSGLVFNLTAILQSSRLGSDPPHDSPKPYTNIQFNAEQSISKILMQRYVHQQVPMKSSG